MLLVSPRPTVLLPQRDSSESAVTALDHSAELRVSGRLDQAVSEAVSAENDVVDATDRAAVPSAFAAAATPLAIGVSVLGALLIGITLYGTTDMSPMSMGILVLLPLSAFEGTAILPSAAGGIDQGAAGVGTHHGGTRSSRRRTR